MKKSVTVNVASHDGSDKDFDLNITTKTGADFYARVDYDDVDHKTVDATMNTIKTILENHWDEKLFQENLLKELRKEWDAEKDYREEYPEFLNYAKTRGWKEFKDTQI